MLAKTLQRVIAKKLTNAREIGELTGKAPSTVYRWISGDSEPDFNSIRLLLRHLPNPLAQQALLSMFTAGTAWQVFRDQSDLDANHDGHISVEDALDATIHSVKVLGGCLAHMRETSKTAALAPEDVVTTVAHLDEVIQHCHISRRVLVKLCEQQRKRRLKLAK
jgi:hypothetical protein